MKNIMFVCVRQFLKFCRKDLDYSQLRCRKKCSVEKGPEKKEMVVSNLEALFNNQGDFRYPIVVWDLNIGRLMQRVNSFDELMLVTEKMLEKNKRVLLSWD